MSTVSSRTPQPVALWIVLCAFLNCAGWILSAFHHLDRLGYVGMFALAAAAVAWWKSRHPGARSDWGIHKLSHRFKRSFPFAFLILAVLAFLGGAIYAPSNYDGLAYRTPRVLHWLAEGRWHWIHTNYQAQNTRAVGYEWVTAPLILFTRSYRLLFLIEIVSFLLLPGLVFSVFTRLGVRPRVAWHWMWLLPTGYGFLLQAGSIGNDLFGATLALAALDLALRARDSKNCAESWLSILAASLLSGGKLSNAPLLLPWFIAFLPSIPLLKKRLTTTLAVCAVGAICSFLPMAVANYEHGGDWTGLRAEGLSTVVELSTLRAYAAHLAFGPVMLALDNFVPPVFPFAGQWNRAVIKLVPKKIMDRLEEYFWEDQAHMTLGELQIEETAGLGFGLSVLLALSLLVARKYAKAKAGDLISPTKRGIPWALLISAFFSLVAYMAKCFGAEARLLLPYYGFIIPLLLNGESQARIIKTRWWKASAKVVFLLAGVPLILSPARPLWPAQRILSRFGLATNPFVARAQAVYFVYAERPDGFAPVRRILPANVSVLGLISIDDPETSLWIPFGARRVEQVTPTDTLADLRRQGIIYILIKSDAYKFAFSEPFEKWMAQHNAELIETVPLTLRVSAGPVDCLLVEIKN
jgi:hypothetical protein